MQIDMQTDMHIDMSPAQQPSGEGQASYMGGEGLIGAAAATQRVDCSVQGFGTPPIIQRVPDSLEPASPQPSVPQCRFQHERDFSTWGSETSSGDTGNMKSRSEIDVAMQARSALPRTAIGSPRTVIGERRESPFGGRIQEIIQQWPRLDWGRGGEGEVEDVLQVCPLHITFKLHMMQ